MLPIFSKMKWKYYVNKDFVDFIAYLGFIVFVFLRLIAKYKVQKKSCLLPSLAFPFLEVNNSCLTFHKYLYQHRRDPP